MQINAFINSDASSVLGDVSNVFLSQELCQTPKIISSHDQPFSIDFKSRTLMVEILFQGRAVVHFQEQSISFTVFGQRAGIYIKNRQTGREKIDGILFPAGRE